MQTSQGKMGTTERTCFNVSKFLLISKTKNKVTQQNACPLEWHHRRQGHLLYSLPSRTAARYALGPHHQPKRSSFPRFTDGKTKVERNQVPYLRRGRVPYEIIYLSDQEMSTGLWGPTQSAEQRRETRNEPSNGSDECLRWVAIEESRV